MNRTSWRYNRPGRLKATVLVSGLAGISLFGLLLIVIFLDQSVDVNTDERLIQSVRDVAVLPERVADRFINRVSYYKRDVRSKLATTSEMSETAQLPVIHLSVAPQHTRKLFIKRDQAVRDGVLISEPDDEVPAVLTLNKTQRLNVDIRLKGDWVDHLGKKKFSLRVKSRGNNAILGMRRFSIQNPATRNGHRESILLDHIRSEGLLAPRYGFSHVKFNDHSMGIMAIEEHFSKELLESQSRREGVILAFDENLMWRQRRLNRKVNAVPIKAVTPENLDSVHLSSHTNPFKVFQERRVLKSDTLRADYRRAIGTLRGYQLGWIDSDEVFDEVQYGRYTALMNFWSIAHGVIDHNVRFYFNPISLKFEPIAFDNMANNHSEIDSDISSVRFTQLWSSRRFRDAYVQTLLQLKSNWESGELTDFIRERDQLYLDQLSPEYPNGRNIDLTPIKARLDYLISAVPEHRTKRRRSPERHKVVLAKDPQLDSAVALFWNDGKEESWLEVANLLPIPGHIVDAWALRTVAGSSSKIPIEYTDAALSPNGSHAQRTRLPALGSITDFSLRHFVSVKMHDIDKVFTIEALRQYPPHRNAPLTILSSKQPQNHSFIIKSEDDWTIKAGDWSVAHSIMAPAGTAVVVQPGTTLRFAENARMVVRGQFSAEGTEDDPIRLVPEMQTWLGLVVLGEQTATTMNYVDVSGVSSGKESNWNLTGAVTLWNTQIQLTDSRFSDIETEDALNGINCSVNFQRISFTNSVSDAIDFDFCNGVVNDLSFSTIQGDALDISGSTLQATKMKMTNVGDKAISVGESSTFVGSSIRVESATTGIAVKDSSTAKISDSQFNSISQAAFTSYIKKPEYSYATLDVRNSEVDQISTVGMAISPSVITIDGQELASSRRIDSAFYEELSALWHMPDNDRDQP